MENLRNLGSRLLKNLQISFDSEFDKKGKINRLVLNPSSGSGEIRCVAFNEGISVVEFELTSEKDITFSLDKKNSQMVFFMNCLKGNCEHKFSQNPESNAISELQTAVSFSNQGFYSEITVKKDVPLIFNLVVLDKTAYLSNSKEIIANTGVDIKKLLRSFNSKRGTFFLGHINHEIEDLIGLLGKAKFVDDAAMLLYFEGICHLIVAKQIEQYSVNKEMDDDRTSHLIKSELEVVSKIITGIKENPEKHYCIEDLARNFEIAIHKLQQGFKQLHNTTVSTFITNVRLKKAEKLLRTTDMKVSEVVYTVGITSRSQFNKIFRGKYGCVPSKYRDVLKKIYITEKQLS